MEEIKIVAIDLETTLSLIVTNTKSHEYYTFSLYDI
jgi:hypothetical protein